MLWTQSSLAPLRAPNKGSSTGLGWAGAHRYLTETTPAVSVHEPQVPASGSLAPGGTVLVSRDMSDSRSESALATVLSDRKLLSHPFYRRWERGEVSTAELAGYAAQYRHFERYLPHFLTALIERLPQGTARHLVEANLADEKGDPIPHIERFEGFAEAVGAEFEESSPAMSSLIATYERLLEVGPEAALAGFVAYESQSSEVADRKAEGLHRYYGLDDEAVSFWEHHATVDVRHGEWSRQALDECSEDNTGLLFPFARQAADAWWFFLDEREELAEAISA